MPCLLLKGYNVGPQTELYITQKLAVDNVISLRLQFPRIRAIFILNPLNLFPQETCTRKSLSYDIVISNCF